jgi:heme/copper-type cytochrome/quinol oxidase subunit 1
MRNFRRLPPLLCVVDIAALLFALSTIVLVVGVFLTSLSSFPHWPMDVLVIALNLGMLGTSCSFVVQTYSTRFRRPSKGQFPLDSWQRQVQALLLVAALPLCALALVAVISPTQPTFALVIVFSMLAGFLLVVANWWMNHGRHAAD